MKTIFLTLLILTVAYPHVSNAQLIKSYGLKVALTSAAQAFDYPSFPSPEMKRRVGFNIGGFVEWFNAPFVSLVSQIEYTQRGAGQDFLVTGPASPVSLGVKTFYSRLDYLSIPVLFKIRLQSRQMVPYLFAGPRLDILLGYRSEQEAFNSVYDKFKKTSLGGSVGVGVQIESLLPCAVLAEARYNFDFADAYKTDLLMVRNNAFDFWLGVAF